MYVGGTLQALQVSSMDVIPFLRAWLEVFHLRFPERRVNIATERYITAPGAKHTAQNDATRINGALREMVKELDPDGSWLDLVEQNAGDAKTCADNALLKLLGFDQPGKVHAADAVRHALLRLLSRFPAEFLRVRNGRYVSVNTPEPEPTFVLEVSSGVR
jgi:hypothetical protein